VYGGKKMLNSENIGKRLRRMREFFKFTQHRMAEVLKIQESTYKKNEKGLHLFNLITLDQLHDELGISTEWLLFGNGPIYWQDIRAKADDSKDAGLMKKDLFIEEMEEMVETLKKVPMVRHLVMGRYQDCKIRYKDLIAECQGGGK
ncbi:MAG TPA: helix-turn-helix transcriptional regulator, partial [Candidatus Kapabacteria bacterium]|nr:helix-turn-helix transcriptional regulator [Candidatus Kapabacteria bacterium]